MLPRYVLLQCGDPRGLLRLNRGEYFCLLRRIGCAGGQRGPCVMPWGTGPWRAGPWGSGAEGEPGLGVAKSLERDQAALIEHRRAFAKTARWRRVCGAVTTVAALSRSRRASAAFSLIAPPSTENASSIKQTPKLRASTSAIASGARMPDEIGSRRRPEMRPRF